MGLSDSDNEVIYFMDRGRKAAKLPTGIEASLELHGKKKSYRVILGRTVIGRGTADLKIDDPLLSDEHAAIGYFDGIFFILDLKSKNGTFVNGQKVAERVLHDGDEVKIGGQVLTFNVSGRLHDEATGKWSDSEISVARILEAIGSQKSSIKFDEPTRIVIDGGKKTAKPPLTQLFFEIKSGPEKGRKCSFLQKEIEIGRRGDFALRDPDVSKKHAEIVIYGPEEIFIRDIGSTNGTFVNEVKVDRIKLKSGDKISVGSTVMEVSFGEIITEPKPLSDDQDPDKTERKDYVERIITLQIVKGRDRGKKVNLPAGEHTIGREFCALSLNDVDVSREHAKITVDAEGKAAIRDCGSTNGTYLNGKRMEEAELKKEDEITVGQTTIKVI